MECPRCRLLNPLGSAQCDCGYDFQTGMVGNHDRSEIGRRYSPPDNTFERSVKALGRWLLQIIIGIVLWMLWTTVKYYIGILPAIAAILIVGAVSILIIVRLGHSGSTEASAYRVPGTSMTCSNCSASFLIQARAQCGVPCPSCGGLTSEEARRRSLVRPNSISNGPRPPK